MTAAKTKTTTVRFDLHQWQELATTSEQLGVAKARFIRDSTIDRLAGLRTVEHLAGDTIERLVRIRIGELLRQHDGRLGRLELQVAHHLLGGRR